MTRSNDSLKVIVVGIPKTLDDAGLLDLFSAYGAVADAKVVKDAATDTSRGFGFVTFTAQSAMRRAVKEMDKKQLEGRTLNVRQLVAKDQLQKRDTSEKAAEMAQRPCYLLRKGKCTKGDRCPFSHEIKGGDFGSCFEFVQNGSCKRGDNCKFFHPPPAGDDGADEAKSQVANGDREFEPTTIKQEPKASDTKNAKNTDNKTNDKKPKDAKIKDDKPRYCFAFQSGRCHRGKRCLFLHEKLVVPENAAPAASTTMPRKRPGDFEVVKDEESNTKRRRESDGEDSEMDYPSSQKPSKAKLTEKKTEEKNEKPGKTQPVANDKPVKPEKVIKGDDGKPVHTGPKPICRHFLKGLCKRGHICFFRHEQPTEEELKDLLPLIKGGKKSTKKDGDASDDENEDATPLQAVADHMASFMANFDVSKPFEPFVPSTPNAIVVENTKTMDEKASLGQPRKRKASIDREETSEEETDAPVPVSKRPRTFPKEKIDMGAAFDGVDSDDDYPRRKRKPTKEEMKASREKLRAERRAKKQSKKFACERLKTDGEIELC